MASEAKINASLTIAKGNVNYRSFPTSFSADVSASKGPTPGAIAASLLGTQVSFSQLTTPGFCRITNLDPDNYVEVGIYDGTEFYPLLELLPGEFYIIRLSRYLGRSMDGAAPGTGTFDLGTYSMMVKATVAPCNVVVEAFER